MTTAALLSLVAPLTAVSAEPLEVRLWESIRAARIDAGSPPLRVSGAAADVASRWAERVARRPASRRLRDEVAIESELRGAGLNEVRRVRHRLLEANDALARAARRHSADMADRDYFDHFSPEGTGPLQRATAVGIGRVKIGENLHKNRGALDPVRTVIDGWLASRPHRKAMLDADFAFTGVGVAQAADGTLYFTQLFSGRGPRAGGRR